MTQPHPPESLLPWNNSDLESILRDLIGHGSEASKVDFKEDLLLSSPDQKSELLKDITAIANTYQDALADYGFLIFGVKAKSIVGTTHTEQNPDRLQNDIEQLLKHHISPMPVVYVSTFTTTTGQHWGVVVIPPRNEKPYMFVRELQCKDPRHTRLRGQWYVRHGATTDPGLPEDLAVIMQRQTDLRMEPLRESIRALQLRVAKTEEQYDSALFGLVRRIAGQPALVTSDTDEDEPQRQADVEVVLGESLSSRIKRRFRASEDAIADALVAEARRLREFLDSGTSGLPWTPQFNNAEQNKATLELLEEQTRELQVALATIALKDAKGAYTDAASRAVAVLARIGGAPSGTSFNRVGEAIRVYPLLLILYTLFACTAAVNRAALLKRILAIPIRYRRENITEPITNAIYRCYDARQFVNDALQQRWCEPLGERARQVIRDHVSELATDSPEEEFFFRGEFMLSLAGIESTLADKVPDDHVSPLPGLFLYLHDAYDAIAGLLTEHPPWIDSLYSHPMTELLAAFDRSAHKAVSPHCCPSGLHRVKMSTLYVEHPQ